MTLAKTIITKRAIASGLTAAALIASLAPALSYAQETNVNADASGEAILLADEPVATTPEIESEDSLATSDADAAAATNADTPAGTLASVNSVRYLERGWDGAQVTESDEPCSEYKPLPDNGKLDGGWYVLDADRAYKNRMEVTGDTHLILSDGCTLEAKDGIYVAEGATLSIYSGTEETGCLIATAKTGAGIGAYSGHKGGDIVIHSGHVKATAGKHCAGIGSNDGDGGKVGKITIYGGEVTAKGGNDGAGIGGGRKSSCDVTIYGGTVTANGKEDGAGIGSGEDSDSGSVVICGGTVTASADTQGAGIGGGNNGSGGTVEISGGEVNAHSGGDGAAIGGGEDGNGGTITISGGTVKALDAKNGAAIGGGNHSGSGKNITISGGTVTAESADGAGIGGGRAAATSQYSTSKKSGSGGTITISGGDVTATSKHAHGIGAGGAAASGKQWSGYIGGAGDITIDSGIVTSQGGVAGIGGDKGNLNINGGHVIATGYNNDGSGICMLDKGSTLNIKGGYVEATGYDMDPGIAANFGYDINITSGEVHANGDKRPGIGSDVLGDNNGTVYISGSYTRVFSKSKQCVAIGDPEKGQAVSVNIKNGATLVANSSKGAFGVKNLDIYDEAMVRSGAIEGTLTTQLAADRISAATSGKTPYVSIEPCDHANTTLASSQTGHHTCCEHCTTNFNEESHDFDEHRTCTVCGYEDAVMEPRFAGVEAINDGRIGLRFELLLPAEHFDRDACSVELTVAGKGGKTITVPFNEMVASERDNTFFVDCPLNVIQMADQVSATLHYDTDKTLTKTTSLAEWIISTVEGSGRTGAAVDRACALADFGHYSQVQLSRDRGFTLGEGCDHELMSPATTFDEATVDRARTDIAQLGNIETVKCDTVNNVTMASRLDSETTMRVTFKTSEQVKEVTIDGELAPESSVQKVADGYAVIIGGIHASQMADAHEISFTTTGDGNTTATVSNLSPVTYAGSIMNSPSFADDDVVLNATTALIRYWQAAH